MPCLMKLIYLEVWTEYYLENTFATNTDNRDDNPTTIQTCQQPAPANKFRVISGD